MRFKEVCPIIEQHPFPEASAVWSDDELERWRDKGTEIYINQYRILREKYLMMCVLIREATDTYTSSLKEILDEQENTET